ncbi:Rv3235 family protein [Kitasatospora camelliae]|uniref:Rv3235 family protein n=1 Tax=Kitasatospora camelliae TaxID=3156397 RepID=A0AAU8JVG7_9ACTN
MHDPAATAPRIRPLVHVPGRPRTRRPVRHPHPPYEPHAPHAPHTPHSPHAPRAPHTPHSPHPQHPRTARPTRTAARSTAPPRPPRHPRAACAAAPSSEGPGDLASRFAHRLVEVLSGIRPAGHLQRHTTLQGYQQLTALVRTGPLRPGGRVPRMRLGRVYDSIAGPGALEACVRVEVGPRHHMVAFRLERHRTTEQWQCAAVEAR